MKNIIRALRKVKAVQIVRKLIVQEGWDEDEDEQEFKEQTPGVSVVESLIDDIKPKLTKIGYRIGQKLDSGEFGITYDIDDNKVLKISIDSDEAYTSAALINKNLKYVVKIFRVFQLKSFKDDEIWFIVQEKLKPLSDSEKYNLEFLEENRWHTNHVKDYLDLNRRYKLQNVEGYIKYYKEKTPESANGRIRNLKEILKLLPPLSKIPAVARGYLLQHYNLLVKIKDKLKYLWPHLQELLLGLEELYNTNITFFDTHLDNIMKTAAGTFKWIDLGAGSNSYGRRKNIEEVNAKSLFIKKG